MFIGIIAFLGLAPNYMVSRIIVPMSKPFTYNDYYVNYLLKTSIWNIHDLLGIAIALALGAGFYILFKRKELFSYSPPDYVSVEYSVYNPAVKIPGSCFHQGWALY
jgi:hypothetical protein